MKNVPIYYARTLIIARIAATIIPTPIDFNNLIIIMRVLKSRICSSIAYVKQEQTISFFNTLFS